MIHTAWLTTNQLKKADMSSVLNFLNPLIVNHLKRIFKRSQKPVARASISSLVGRCKGGEDNIKRLIYEGYSWVCVSSCFLVDSLDGPDGWSCACASSGVFPGCFSFLGDLISVERDALLGEKEALICASLSCAARGRFVSAVSFTDIKYERIIK